MVLMKCRRQTIRVLACREIQTSIKASVHALMRNIIYANGWQYQFKVTAAEIRHIETDSLITFAGLKNNPESVKSTENISIVFIEEAQTISEMSMQLLIPTVRRPGSEIWMAMNPRYSTDYCYDRFVKRPDDNVLSVAVNWQDNPFFPEVLRQEMQRDKEKDYELYKHTWEGSLRPHGERPLFTADSLQRAGSELFGEPSIHGLDLSWSGDYALTGISESPDKHELYIHSCAVKSKVPLLGLADWIGVIDTTLVVDNARPEVIDLLQKAGYSAKRSKKGAGSVQKGADRMARYERIWFAPGTDDALQEFSELGFDENDELTGKRDVWDSVRYGLERMGGFKTISWGAL